MTLGELIAALEQMPADRPVKRGFGRPHHHRDHPVQLAFSPVPNTTVGQMLADARSAVGVAYGGHLRPTMDAQTEVWVAADGQAGEPLGRMLLELLTQCPIPRTAAPPGPSQTWQDRLDVVSGRASLLSDAEAVSAWRTLAARLDGCAESDILGAILSAAVGAPEAARRAAAYDRALATAEDRS